MLIKDLFINQPSKKDEYWKYTDTSFLNLNFDEKSSYSLKTSLKNIHYENKQEQINFYNINKVLDREYYLASHNDIFELNIIKGLIFKHISFIIPDNAMITLDIHLTTQESIQDLFALIKFDFLVEGVLNLNIYSSIDKHYLLEDINFFLNEDAQINVNYISKGMAMKKTVINSLQHDNTKLNILFRTFLLGNDNVDFSIISKIAGKGCFLNHDIKAVLNDESTFSCLGEIDILTTADNAEANHYTSTLALSENIRINSRPVLKINNGNVKCSHGSPSSYIQEEDLFYMRSRGLSKKDAYKMYIKSFLNIENKMIQKLIDIGV